MDTETKVVIGVCSAGALIMLLVIMAAIQEANVQRAMYDECTETRLRYECYAMVYKGRTVR